MTSTIDKLVKNSYNGYKYGLYGQNLTHYSYI